MLDPFGTIHGVAHRHRHHRWLYCQPHHEWRGQGMLHEPYRWHHRQLCRSVYQFAAQRATAGCGLPQEFHLLPARLCGGVVDLEENIIRWQGLNAT